MFTPMNQQELGNLKQSAGPATRPDRLVTFDANEGDELSVPSHHDGNPSGTFMRALVNPIGEDGLSLLGVRYEPNKTIDRHKHDVPQIVLVLEGEIRQGRKVFGPGMGYYTPAGMPYKLVVGSQGARLVEFRPSPLTFRTDWLDTVVGPALTDD